MGENEFALAMQCGYKQGYEDGAIAELENIKEEIDTLYSVYYSYFKERLVIKSDVMRILDEHISELKGEQKQ